MTLTISIIHSDEMSGKPNVLFTLLKNDDFELMINSQIVFKKPSLLDVANAVPAFIDDNYFRDWRVIDAFMVIRDSIVAGKDWVEKLGYEEYCVTVQISTVNDILKISE